MRFATPQGFNSGDQFFAYLRDTFDVLYAEGAAGAPKMMSIGLHCRLVGRPGRIRALERFLDQYHTGTVVLGRLRGARLIEWEFTGVDRCYHPFFEEYPPIIRDDPFTVFKETRPAKRRT